MYGIHGYAIQYTYMSKKVLYIDYKRARLNMTKKILLGALERAQKSDKKGRISAVIKKLYDKKGLITRVRAGCKSDKKGL